MKPQTVSRVVALGRAAFGAALTLRTESFLRTFDKNAEPTGSVVLWARTVGIRDLVLGVGALVASFGEGSDLRRWVGVSLASDSLDLVSGMASAKQVGVSGSITATAASAPFVAAGLWTLRRLTAPPSPD